MGKRTRLERIEGGAPPAQRAPSITVNATTGELELQWPDPRPESFVVTAEVIEQLVGLVNTRVRQLAAARALFARLGELGAGITAGDAVR